MSLPRIQQVCIATALYGLHMHPSQLSEGERAEVRKQMEAMLREQEGISTKELVEAIRFGMKQVWPFIDRGFFDARDVRSNISKAKAAASKMRRRGELPQTAEEVTANFERHREEQT